MFPGSTQAAVHAMNVRLGERLLTARIREKQQARIEYEQRQARGQDQRAARAAAAQRVRDERRQHPARRRRGGGAALHRAARRRSDAQYGFVFPTVVGPRYNSPQGAAAGERWIATPYAAAPVRAARLRPQGHAGRADRGEGRRLAVARGARSTAPAARDARVALKPTERPAQQPRLHPALPPRRRPHRVGPDAVPRRRGELLPRDGASRRRAVPARRSTRATTSSSSTSPARCTAFRWTPRSSLLQQLIGGLRPSDTFNVMLFSGSSRMLAPQSVPATLANIDAGAAHHRRDGRRRQHRDRAGAASASPRCRSRPTCRAPSIVITDGYVAVENEVFQLVRRQLGHTNVFAFGIGSQRQPPPDRRHRARRPGRGLRRHQARRRPRPQAERLRRMIESPVLTQVKARFEGLEVYDVEPAQLPDVLGGRPVVVFGKWRGDQPAPGGRLVVEGRSARRRLARRAGRRRPRRARRPRRCATCGRASASRCSATRRRSTAASARRRRSPTLGLQLQPADRLHQLHRGRPGRAQPESGARDRAVDQPPPLPARRERPGDRRRGAEHAGAGGLAARWLIVLRHRRRDASSRGAAAVRCAAMAPCDSRTTPRARRWQLPRHRRDPAVRAWLALQAARAVAALALGRAPRGRRLGRPARRRRARRCWRARRAPRAAAARPSRAPAWLAAALALTSRRDGGGVRRAAAGRRAARGARARLRRWRAFMPSGRAGAAAGRPGGAGAAGGLVAAVLRRLSAARGSPRSAAAGCCRLGRDARRARAARRCRSTAGWSSSTRRARACRWCGWRILRLRGRRVARRCRDGASLRRLPWVGAHRAGRQRAAQHAAGGAGGARPLAAPWVHEAVGWSCSRSVVRLRCARGLMRERGR